MEKYNIIAGLNLAEGSRITIVSQNDIGFDYVVKMKYLRCSPAPHYYNCSDTQLGAALVGVPYRKRSAYRLTLDYNTPFIIYDGWRDIDLDSAIREKEERGSVTVTRDKYSTFDRQKYVDIAERYSDGILASSF